MRRRRRWTTSTGSSLRPPAADDERGEQDAELAEVEEAAQIEAITEAAESGAVPDPGEEQTELWRREQALLDRMEAIAERARHVPDTKTLRLIDWIRDETCARTFRNLVSWSLSKPHPSGTTAAFSSSPRTGRGRSATCGTSSSRPSGAPTGPTSASR